MQTETYTRLAGGLAGAVVITIGLLAFTPSLTGAAQDTPQPPAAGGRMGPHRGGPGGRGGPGAPGGRMGGPMGGVIGPVMRDLTDAQREQVRAIRERHAEEIRPLAERVHTARQAISGAVFAGNADVRELALTLGNAEAEMAVATAQVESEVLAILTPEQKQKITAFRKEMESRRGQMLQRRNKQQ
jgi:Spy/CpxP family protein refolding chaperone